jgi:hypothetical protein
MPGTPTTRVGIPLPAGGDEVQIPADLRAVAEHLDEIVAIDDQGAIGAMPSPSGKRGFYWWATDALVLLRSTGTTWVVVSAATPLVSAVPEPLIEGQRFAIRPDATNHPAVRWVYERRNNQWMLVDGQPLLAKPAGGVTTSSQTPVVLMNGPVIPFKGTYRVRFGAVAVKVGNGVEVATTNLFANGASSGASIQEYIAAAATGGPRTSPPVQFDVLNAGTGLSITVQTINGVSTAFSAGWIELSPLSAT